jgi:hypothetical protein
LIGISRVQKIDIHVNLASKKSENVLQVFFWIDALYGLFSAKLEGNRAAEHLQPEELTLV